MSNNVKGKVLTV